MTKKNEEYFIVHKSMLPECYQQVIQVRDWINSEHMNVSDACKKAEISRSTYYKYKDYIYPLSKELGKKAVLSLNIMDERGQLSLLLNVISSHGANVLAIYQDTPIQNNAYITMTIDIKQLDSTIQQLIEELKEMNCVKTVELLAIE